MVDIPVSTFRKEFFAPLDFCQLFFYFGKLLGLYIMSGALGPWGCFPVEFELGSPLLFGVATFFLGFGTLCGGVMRLLSKHDPWSWSSLAIHVGVTNSVVFMTCFANLPSELAFVCQKISIPWTPWLMLICSAFQVTPVSSNSSMSRNLWLSRAWFFCESPSSSVGFVRDDTFATYGGVFATLICLAKVGCFPILWVLRSSMVSRKSLILWTSLVPRPQ